MAASAISACEKAGQWRHVVALLLDVISNTSANNACDKGGRGQHALGLLLRIRNNLLPDGISTALVRRVDAGSMPAA